MAEIKTVSIIGLGALGILFGHHLSKKMPVENLRIIADQQRIERYKREGVYCNGEKCHFYYVTPEETVEPADLVLFTVKFNGLDEAVEAVKQHVGPDTVILSALNGISSEEIIGRTYGMDKMLYCVAQGMDAVKAGNQLTYAHMGMLCFGEKKPGIFSEKMKKVARFFEQTDLPYEADTEMMKRLWGKFMLNVGVNQTVAVYKSNYGEIQKDGPAREMMIAAMREVMALSEKEGFPLTEEDLRYWLKVVGNLSPAGKPSMAQDVEAKRYSEVGLFSGTVIKLGKKYGVPVPVNEELNRRIREIERTYAAVH
ncbi:2-dehydropantoate 2-reductase [Heyndrickxia faecalis]|uniref:ketopantoate reductase family protein n=2 Tax=Bacillaceae TaxID=186817 RepID=UPI000552A5DF|nr:MULTISPECIES: 2-dehydropantoate 2-reductase [Heyndrickxia]KGT39951.1 2-dehydropantoate 2-reductase [Heyndrickxia coagulans P38]MED4320752.1 2-dehydropantoate 2-reductase [Weizmannia sp. CD-2023]MED4839522.1 2-dehydropantoate 2-reductase [Weizmannia sp. CD-2023]MED4867356.1 2-dehydropantoate 2-reductase [Weizmannia sp. CD-2023]NMH85612.1 2-dehydropantoate 2-reductase [Heyndrickxia coagulans]